MDIIEKKHPHKNIINWFIKRIIIKDFFKKNKHDKMSKSVINDYYKFKIFDEKFYLSNNKDVQDSGIDALEHYLSYGWKERRQPSPYFDIDYYLSEYPDVYESGHEPLSHFIQYGWLEGRNPSLKFNTNYYLNKYDDVRNSGMNPLEHWIEYGHLEKRKCNVKYIERTSSETNFPTIIFVSHEASGSGAPAVLLTLMDWIKENTNINFSIIVGSSGPWNNKFKNIAPTFFFDKPHTEKDIRDFCGNNVQLIYVNTIVAARYANSLSFLHAEFITHVHEMENVFNMFDDEVKILSGICRKYISVSSGSTKAIENKINGVDIHHIKPFIAPYQRKMKIRKSNNKKVIFGCGAVEKRKGFDIFCDVAKKIKAKGCKNVEMHWIGSDAGKDLNANMIINECGVSDIVKYLGVKSNPRDYFHYADLFLLPSREDPYPLVCIEAAEHQLPIVCFDERAGDMFSFVEEDAGQVVEYLNLDAMSDAVMKLISSENRLKTLGKKAKQKVIDRHYVSFLAPKILELFPKLSLVSGSSEIEVYKAIIEKAKIVSFDIFDTLVTRKVSKPETIFDVIEYNHTVNETEMFSFFKERVKAAGNVLKSYNGKRDDVNIDEIYESMSIYSNSRIEKDTEINACEVQYVGYELYQYALSLGKIIYITSDMYLDKETIAYILNDNGYYKWDELFLSSERGNKKDTGRLFEEVILSARNFDVSPEEIVHIGDSWCGDIKWARRLGITAIRFNPIYESSANNIIIPDEKECNLSQVGRIWNCFSKQATRKWVLKNSELSNDFFIKLGMEVTGPLAAQMAIHTKRLADKEKVKKIIFMARDGRIIKKAFDMIYSNEIKEGHYETLYLNLSRATVIPATMSNPLSSSDLYFLSEGLHLAEKPISYFIEKAGLDKSNDKIIENVCRYFGSLEFIPKEDDLPKFSMLFEELSNQIFEQNKKYREGLILYLEQYGILNESQVIIVDVGWFLNIQSRLVSFLKKYKSKTKIIGSYFGSREKTNKSINQSSLIYNFGEPVKYARFIDDNVTLFELLFSSPEASASYIDISDGKARVDFKTLTVPFTKEFQVAQKIHMGAEFYFEYLSNEVGRVLPEQTSQDYVYYLFKSLVETDDKLAISELTNFEIRVGGHHEFITYQDLLKKDDFIDYIPKPMDEYFEPIEYVTNKNDNITLIVTSAGLNNGSTRYRALNYAEKLQSDGHNAVVLHAKTDIFKFKVYLNKVDKVIFQRCFSAQGNVNDFFDLARKYKIECIFEIDDLVFPEHVSLIGSVRGGEWDKQEAMLIAKSYESFMLQTDRCIVSTQALKEYIENTYGLFCEVVHNKVSIRKYKDKVLNKGERLKLIYSSGTFSHKEDFSIIENDLYHLLVDNPKILLSLLGSTPVSGRILALPNVSCYPLLPYNSMLDFIAKHHLMLVPLADNIFNHSKSNVKYIECQAVGVDVLASGVGEYSSSISENIIYFNDFFSK